MPEPTPIHPETLRVEFTLNPSTGQVNATCNIPNKIMAFGLIELGRQVLQGEYERREKLGIIPVRSLPPTNNH